ncbi:MAG: hypothetical protein CEE43_12325 [Promethearchaeota archaeon Loki_b32]|nr:MAG: hypothetical protein CEE43_12325 [Candidatus Lokiarchaeota archaeon Loki_b32]
MQLRRFRGTTFGTGDTFHNDEFKIFSEYDIEIMFLPSTIKRYLENIQKLQSLEYCEYFPLSEKFVKNFFSNIKPEFDYQNIKYDNTSKLDLVSRIISYIGKSGYNYIKSVNNVIFLNQPVLLFYGIEQLATYFSYIHFNFSAENKKIESIRGKFRHHGINPKEFNNIDSSSNIEDLLNYNIELLVEGATQRFFFVLGFPVQDYFFKKIEYSLLDLIRIFFTKLHIGLSNKTIGNFLDDFPTQKEIKVKDLEDINLLVFYILSFLFSHLSRYKIFTWQKLTQTDEKNLGFYIKFMLDYIKSLFVRKIFSILEYEKNRMFGLIKHPTQSKLFKERWSDLDELL